jgi:hypothetical protein
MLDGRGIGVRVPVVVRFLYVGLSMLFRSSSGSPMWDVDVGGDGHVLIFYTVIYCPYAKHTDELQLER